MAGWDAEYIWIFDNAENMVAALGTAPEACPFFDCEMLEVLNGVNTLTFSVPADHPDAEKVVRGYIAVIEDIDGNYRAFRILSHTESYGEDGARVRTVNCEDIAIDELNVAVVIERSAENISDAMIDALSTAIWNVGTINGSFPAAHIEFYHQTAMECLQKIAETWGCEFRFRIEHDGVQITGRYVDVFAQMGADNGVRITADMNMRSLESEDDMTGLITAVYPYGKGEPSGDGYGRRLSIEDVEWSVANGDPVDKPTGQAWIGDPVALAQWGLKGGTIHRYGVVIFEDIEDPAELIQAGWDYLQQNNKPKTQLDVSIQDLEASDGYDHFAVRLGDVVTVIDDDMHPPVEYQARVVQIKRRPGEPEKTELTIGQKLETMADVTRSLVEDVKRSVKQGEPLNFLDATIATLRDELTGAVGYTYISPDDGILVTDAPKGEQAKSAIQIKAGIFAIANEWDPNANDFKWKTFGTGDGFTADMITTGTLNANLVRIVSDDGNTRVEVYSGRLFSYYQDHVTMSVGGYTLRIYDHGAFATTPDYGMLSVMGTAWRSRTGDPSGVYNNRGIFWGTLKDFVAIGYAVQTGDDLFTNYDALQIDYYGKKTFLVGPSLNTDTDYTQMYFSPTRQAWDHGGSVFENPSIRLQQGNAQGGSPYYSDVQIYIGSPYAGTSDYPRFQVWRSKGNQQYDIHLGLYPTDYRLFIGPYGAKVDYSTDTSTYNSTVRWAADNWTYYMQTSTGYHWFYSWNGSTSKAIARIYVDANGNGVLQVWKNNAWYTVA